MRGGGSVEELDASVDRRRKEKEARASAPRTEESHAGAPPCPGSRPALSGWDPAPGTQACCNAWAFERRAACPRHSSLPCALPPPATCGRGVSGRVVRAPFRAAGLCLALGAPGGAADTVRQHMARGSAPGGRGQFSGRKGKGSAPKKARVTRGCARPFPGGAAGAACGNRGPPRGDGHALAHGLHASGWAAGPLSALSPRGPRPRRSGHPASRRAVDPGWGGGRWRGAGHAAGRDA